MEPTDILEFWAGLGDEAWWSKNEELDKEIINRFGKLHANAVDGKLDNWADTPDGALALIIVLDQFSRNMFRGSPKAFSNDPKALQITKTAIELGLDKGSREDLRVFFYLPYEHSESIIDQKVSLRLQHSIKSHPGALNAAIEHHEIIKRFGRFPHRNTVLGRHTTPAEQAYLDGGGFKG